MNLSQYHLDQFCETEVYNPKKKRNDQRDHDDDRCRGEGLFRRRPCHLPQLCERLQKELVRLEEDLGKLIVRLENPDFKQKAPQQVVAEHEQRCQELELKKEKLLKSLSELREL